MGLRRIEIFPLRYSSLEIPDGSPADVPCLSEVLAMRPLVNLLVLFNHFGVCRTVVTNQNLIGNPRLLSLLPEVDHQLHAHVVIGGNQYGNCRYCHDSEHKITHFQPKIAYITPKNS